MTTTSAAEVIPFEPLEPLAHGVTLIEASAGTGKTYTITTLILRLVVEEDIAIERILTVTFTEAATAELQGRVRRRLREALAGLDGLPVPIGDAVLCGMIERAGADGAEAAERFVQQARRRLVAAIASFDQAAISTIHGFCQRTLRENAFESGIEFETKMMVRPNELVLEAVSDFWVNRQHAADRAFLAYLLAKRESPETLVRLAEQAAAHPKMPFLPAAVPTLDEGALPAWVDVVRRLQACWREGGADAQQLVRAAMVSGRLSRTSYRIDTIDGKWDEVAGWLAGDPEQLTAPPAALGDLLCRAALLRKANKGAVPPSHPFFLLADEAVERWAQLSQSLEDRRTAFMLELVGYIREEIPRRKRRAQVQTFDDLLNQLDAALEDPVGGERLAVAVRGRYDVALIDEFQDTDPVQFRIFRRIFAERRGGRLFLIGDPKQAIYAFRGADIFAYVEAAEAAPRRRTLTRNYRSAPQLVQGVNTLFGRGERPFLMDAIRFYPVDWDEGRSPALRLPRGGDRPLVINLRSDDPAPDGPRALSPDVAVASSIVRLLSSGAALVGEGASASDAGRPVEPRDIAVLVRSNAQGVEVQRSLLRLGVPCVFQQSSRVFSAPEASELLLVFAAIAEPTDTAALRAALTTSLYGFTGDDLLDLDASPERWEPVTDAFRAWKDLWRARGFMHAFRALLTHPSARPGAADGETAPSRILSRQGGERCMTNLLHLAELVHEATTTERLSIAGTARWLTARLRDGGESEADELRMESDAAAVKVMTIHKSKGLEFPIVYCPYLSQAATLREGSEGLRYHASLEVDGRTERVTVTSLAPTDDEKARAIDEARAEDVRLLYVALTRARERCVAVLDTKAASHAASAFAWVLLAAPGESPDEATARVKAMNRDVAPALEPLVASGAVAVGTLPRDASGPWARPQRPAPALAARTAASRVRQRWSVASFSSLVAEPRSGAGAPPPSQLVDEPRDHDTHAIDPPPHDVDEGPRVVLADLPAGARTGRMIHEVFERVDFTAADGAASRTLVDDVLRLHGFDATKWGPVVHASLVDVVATPLDPTGLTLQQVSLRSRLNELGFTMPVRRGGRGGFGTQLAAALRAWGGPRMLRTADEVERLSASTLEGYLKGYIDLVCEHRGLWYVVDYKSNALGERASDYATDRLELPMADSLYTLQALFYAVAVRRYLRWRVPGWTYGAFGGIRYLFVRGMCPARGASCGVYTWVPPLALVEAVDALLDADGGTR